MSQLMPLPLNDYNVINCPRREFFTIWSDLPERTKYYVANSTHRLAEVTWITEALDKDIITSNTTPVIQEGLLSLQMYLLSTCADALGHVVGTGNGVGQRFRSFFAYLPQDAKDNLVRNFLVWKTNFNELEAMGQADATTNTAYYPSPPRQQILDMLDTKTFNERFVAIVDFLYARRNLYTHESESPRLGTHPNLSVMQNQRLDVPNTATIGELDRLQALWSGDNILFIYYEADDPISVLRWSILRGIGKVIGQL